MVKRIINRPIAVTMVLLGIIVLGIVSAMKLPVGLLPDIDFPYVTIQVEAPGMSARELERDVVTLLRSQFVQMDGLSGLEGDSRDGSARVRLSFQHGDDMDYRFVEVNERLDRCMASLGDISRPKVLKATATDIPAFYINLTSKDDQGDFITLGRFAREVIVKRLEQLDEVAMVDVSGVEEEEILVVPDPARMASLGIGLQDLESLISSADIRLGSLTIRDGQYRYGVRFHANASSLEDIASLWLNHEGRLLQLRDIASVKKTPSLRSGMLSSDGKPAVSLAVIKQSEARMSDLRKAVMGQMNSYCADYPEVSFTITRDQSSLLEYSINSLIQNIIIGILLACVIIFLFMKDFRSPVLVAITIPVSLICSMLVFRLLGMSLNIISLSGLLLGVGMMTDNSLILVDNITGRWQRGDSLKRSILEGTREVSGPMLSSILTTCAVFIPLVMVSGMAGALFRDQAAAVTVVLFSSYIVTITAIPVYYHAFYRKAESFRESPFLNRISFTGALERWDRRWSSFMLSHKWISWTLLGICTAGCILCLSLMPRQMLPEMTREDTILKVGWSGNISPEENMSRCNAISDVSGARQVTAMAGVQQFVLNHGGDVGAGEASVYMAFDSEEDRLLAEARIAGHMASAWPSADFSFVPSGNVFEMVFGQSEPPLVARLRSTQAPSVEVGPLNECLRRLGSALPGYGIGAPKTKEQAVLVADPEKMALYGIGYPAIVSAVRSALNGNRLLKIIQGEISVPVVLGSDIDGLSKILESVSVKTEGGCVPLSAVMRLSSENDLDRIVSGQEGEYYPVKFDIAGRDIPKAMAAIRKTLREDGRFEAGFSGSWFSTGGMVRDLILTVIIAILLLYLILAAQFESLVQPFLILSEIVIDIFFAIGILYLAGGEINLMSMIGLVVITGIVINDSILKIATINRLRGEGLLLQEAILTAGRRRLKAIVMTSLTTILAVCPFLVRGNMGADLQYPMTVVIIAGMVAGTLVSLFVVPAMYASIYKDRK